MKIKEQSLQFLPRGIHFPLVMAGYGTKLLHKRSVIDFKKYILIYNLLQEPMQDFSGRRPYCNVYSWMNKQLYSQCVLT